jgi:hypothetical protein
VLAALYLGGGLPPVVSVVRRLMPPGDEPPEP